MSTLAVDVTGVVESAYNCFNKGGALIEVLKRSWGEEYASVWLCELKLRLTMLEEVDLNIGKTVVK